MIQLTVSYLKTDTTICSLNGTVNYEMVELTVTYRLTDSRQGLIYGIERNGTKR